jgi:cytidylate kinase
MKRDLSPLKKAEDAQLIDSTHRSAEEIVQEMIQRVKEKAKRFT